MIDAELTNEDKSGLQTVRGLPKWPTESPSEKMPSHQFRFHRNCGPQKFNDGHAASATRVRTWGAGRQMREGYLDGPVGALAMRPVH